MRLDSPEFLRYLCAFAMRVLAWLFLWDCFGFKIACLVLGAIYLTEFARLIEEGK